MVAMDQLDPNPFRADLFHQPGHDRRRLVGGVVEHLNVETVARIVLVCRGPDDAVRRGALVVERELDRDRRCIGGFRPPPFGSFRAPRRANTGPVPEEAPEHPELDQAEDCPEQRGEAVQSCNDVGHGRGEVGASPNSGRPKLYAIGRSHGTPDGWTGPVPRYGPVALLSRRLYLNSR
jgi:hypothetical protein